MDARYLLNHLLKGCFTGTSPSVDDIDMTEISKNALYQPTAKHERA